MTDHCSIQLLFSRKKRNHKFNFVFSNSFFLTSKFVWNVFQFNLAQNVALEAKINDIKTAIFVPDERP
jgi:hypothetical protein